MGQMLIRKLDDRVIAKLKERARANGTSAEEEARRSLTADLARPVDVAAVLARFERAREMIGPQSGPTSTEMLRWDRDRDERALFENYDQA